MISMRKTLIMLGAAGAMFVANPIPTMAQGVYFRAPGFHFGVDVPWAQRHHYGAYAYSPRAYRWGHRSRDPYQFWDPYGLRWEGEN
jgi:hypothetical protein